MSEDNVGCTSPSNIYQTCVAPIFLQFATRLERAQSATELTSNIKASNINVTYDCYNKAQTLELHTV